MYVSYDNIASMYCICKVPSVGEVYVTVIVHAGMYS